MVLAIWIFARNPFFRTIVSKNEQGKNRNQERTLPKPIIGP
jgi:hypothetical protein